VSLWLDANELVVFSMHISHPAQQRVSQTAADPEQSQCNGWVDIVRCTEHWDVEITVMPVSWDNAVSIVTIVLYPPEQL
jgi:hypothetical protein